MWSTITSRKTPNSKSWAGANTNKPVTNISEGNGIITFDFMQGSGPTAPAAPTNLTASSSQTSITLNWTDNADNEDGFKIYRGTTSTNLSLIATVGANTTSYVNSGLSRKTTYYYKVCAYNTYGESCSATISKRTR